MGVLRPLHPTTKQESPKPNSSRCINQEIPTTRELKLSTPDIWGTLELEILCLVQFLGNRPVSVMAPYLAPPAQFEICRAAREQLGLDLVLRDWRRGIDPQGRPQDRWFADVKHWVYL